MENKIVKFIECLLPITLCNLKCHYCYVIQRNNRGMKKALLNYPIDQMLESLRPERFGGKVYFSICGAGETTLCEELPVLVKGLLEMGHIVNITTNGTTKNHIKAIIKPLTKENSKGLHFSFSFHYLELKRLNLLETFFEVVQYVKDMGCSFFVQFNMNDEYVPYLNEIKRLVFDKTGALPQIAATRKENNLKSDIELYTNHSKEEYKNFGSAFDSPLFSYTLENFDKPRKEFCHAGEISYVLNLGTGILQQCYASLQRQNIFDNPTQPIKLKAIGHHCCSKFCMNSSHFMSLGVIPEAGGPTYANLRDRITANGDSWYNDYHKSLLGRKLSTKKYTIIEKYKIDIDYYSRFILYWVYSHCFKPIKVKFTNR